MKIKSFLFLTVAIFVILVSVGVGFVVPQIYYYFTLPSTEVVNKSPDIKLAFAGWGLKSDEVIPDISKWNSGVLECSVCYPELKGSAKCKERYAAWISKNLLMDQGPQRMLLFHYKGYSLSRVLTQKYDDSTLLKLYLAFGSRVLKESDIDKYCQKRFYKPCSELNPLEYIDLEFEIRAGSAKKGPAMRELKIEVYEHCDVQENYRAQSDSKRSSEASEVKPAWEDKECYFNKRQIQLGPRVLLETFLASDSRGEFFVNDKFGDFLLCPGHQGGPDLFEVIKGYNISKEKIEKDKAEFSVVFDLLGSISSGGIDGSLNSFTKNVKSEEFVLKMVKTPYGWRINFESTHVSRVLANRSAKYLFHKEWVDGEEALFRAATSNK